jgi:ubiquinone/menaquinone biosynthesis C-methylase UbiE
MSGFYTLAYAIGLRPWERAGRQAAAEFSGALDRETGQRPAPPGRAADVGCGTGAHTIELANRG